jgi:putative endonuclease
MKAYNYYVYIITNWNNMVMYIGMTNNLERRLYEHKNKLVDGFTKKYNVTKLVYYEHGNDVYAAMAREKEIKKWRREKKKNLVVSMNPTWKDLSSEWHVEKISPVGRSDKG